MFPEKGKGRLLSAPLPTSPGGNKKDFRDLFLSITPKFLPLRGKQSIILPLEKNKSYHQMFKNIDKSRWTSGSSFLSLFLPSVFLLFFVYVSASPQTSVS